MLNDEIEKIPIKKRKKKTQVNWVNLPNMQLESWDHNNFIENKLK
jgi:hypothetical protein